MRVGQIIIFFQTVEYTTRLLRSGDVRKKPNEYVLWDKCHEIRTRVNSNHLISWMFYSPYATMPPTEWSTMEHIGYSAYIVTTDGRVYSKHTYKYMVGNKSFDGYSRVCVVSDDGRQTTMVVSRLVALTFIPNPENKPEVNHIDGDKDNNCVTNLEWVYGWENVQHARTTGLRTNKLSDDTIHDICKLLEQGVCVTGIMTQLNVPKHAVLGIKSGCHRRISKLYNIPKNRHFSGQSSSDW